jgi:molybdate transport system regulatory protein
MCLVNSCRYACRNSEPPRGRETCDLIPLRHAAFLQRDPVLNKMLGAKSYKCVTFRFPIDFAKGSYVGPGKIDLLEGIRDSGSLSQAARNIGMSYRRAWLLVDSLNGSFREPVTVASRGGKAGGGVQLTEFGEALINSYRDLERDIASAAVRRLHATIPAVARYSKSAAKSPRRPIVHKRGEDHRNRHSVRTSGRT